MRKVAALKLIDTAILPVVLVVGSKILAVFLLTLIFDIPWKLSNQTGFYLFNFQKATDVFFVSSVSDLVMILVVAIGFLWTLFRGSYFREDRLHPIFAAKLHKKGREGLITSVNSAYHQAAVWLSLSWFTFLLIIENTLSLNTSQITFGIAIVTTFGLTIVLLENQKD